MKLGALAAAAGIELPGGAQDNVTGFAIDHRKVAPGTVFGAFRGARAPTYARFCSSLRGYSMSDALATSVIDAKAAMEADDAVAVCTSPPDGAAAGPNSSDRRRTAATPRSRKPDVTAPMNPEGPQR